MAAKKQPASKLAETDGQIDSAAGKSARPADKISSGGRRDSKTAVELGRTGTALQVRRIVEQILNLNLSFGFTVPDGGRYLAFFLLAGHLRLELIMLLRKGGVPGTAHKRERFECM